MTNTQIIDDVRIAAEALREGRLVAFPTETVYGLGADATNAIAIQRLFEAKGRPSDNPLIVHLGDVSQLPQATNTVGETAWKLLDSFSPGPITIVVEKNSDISGAVTAGLGTVGVRIPEQTQARELLRLVNRPVAAPSANLSGRPSCTTWQSVFDDLDGKIDFILKGEVSRIGIESTVVDCTGSQPILLRAGAITLEQLRRVLPDISCWNDHPQPGTASTCVAPPSPGLRHAHYQPKARVRLVRTLEEAVQSLPVSATSAAYFGHSVAVSTNPQFVERGESSCERKWGMFVQFQSMEEYAKQFYEMLRQADRLGIQEIYLQLAPDQAIGAALRDRQQRAAGVDTCNHLRNCGDIDQQKS